MCSQDMSTATSAVMAFVAAMLRLTRPQQWIKNAVVLAGLVFAELTDQPSAIVKALVALFAFVLASGAVYIVNDVRDVEADRLHPLKRKRPLPQGAVPIRHALIFSAMLAVSAFGIAATMSFDLAATITFYLVMMGAYTFWFKRVPILDVTVIAFGFVLRAVGGAVAVNVPISPWLLLCAFLLALFLGFGKRRAELASLGGLAGQHRQSLRGYTVSLLDQLVAITAVSAIVTYALYALLSDTVPDSNAMLLTLPFVVIAILRYLFLVYRRGLGGSPELLLFRDGWLLGAVAGWGAVAVIVLQGTANT
jgi:4-hydroxybenzoate polyprenyltransferase